MALFFVEQNYKLLKGPPTLLFKFLYRDQIILEMHLSYSSEAFVTRIVYYIVF